MKGILLKTCPTCGICKELDSFHRSKRSPDGHVVYCKPCVKVRAHDLYLRSKDKMYASAMKWRENNKEKHKEYNKLLEQQNKARRKEQRDARRDSINAQISRWKQNNKAKVNAATRSRQARKLNATPSWANKEAIEAKYRLAQYFTDISGGFVEYHVDHIIPLQGKLVCGLHVENNLQVIKAYDNQLKGNTYHVS